MNSQNIVELLENRRLLSAALETHIHFQAAKSAVPTGYVADTGAVYAAQSNGLPYGWNAPLKAQTVSRAAGKNPTSAQLLNHSFAVLNKKGRGSLWEVAVPNGTYTVTVTAGDIASVGLQQINVNGTSIINGRTTAKKRWIVGTQTVTVTDGFIKLTDPRAGSAKINAIDIVQQVAQGGGTPTGGGTTGGTAGGTSGGTTSGTTSQGTLTVKGSNVTITSNAGGGVRTIVDGATTDYTVGQWSAVQYVVSSDTDVFNLQATVVPTSISGAFHSNNTIGIGDLAAGLQNITAPVTMDDTSVNEVVSISDAGDTTGRSIKLVRGNFNTATTVSGLAPAAISFAGQASITTGAGVDTVAVPSTGSGSILWNNTGGADQFTFGDGTLANIWASMALHATAGSNAVVFDGSNAQSQFTLGTADGSNFLVPQGADVADYVAARFDLGSGAPTTSGEISLQGATTPSVVYTDSHDPALPGTQITVATTATISPGNFPASITLNGGPRDRVVVGGGTGPSTIAVTGNQLGAGLNINQNEHISFTGLANSTSKPKLTVAVGEALNLVAGTFSNDNSTLTYTGVNEFDISAATLNLDYGSSNTDPLAPVVKFPITTTITGMPTTSNPFAGHAITFNNRLYITYPAGQSTAMQTLVKKYLTKGYTGGTWQPTGSEFLTTNIIDAGKVAFGLSVGYASQADNLVAFQPANTIELYVTKVGDTDLNGHVTQADLARLQAHLGQAGNWDDGDLNYDGIVDNTDLALLQKYLGT